MKQTKKFAVKVAGVAAIAALAAMSAFADTRHRNETNGRYEQRGDWDRGGNRDSRSVTSQGRISNLSRYRDGYRVQLDRQSQWYYVPQHAVRGRSGRGVDLRIGVNVRFGGYYGNDGYFNVDSCDFVDDGYYGNDGYRGDDGYYGDRYGGRTLNGIVQRVDFRRGDVLIRDSHTGRTVLVEMRRGGRNNRGVDLNDLRRGDRVTFSGTWDGRGRFEAYRIDGVRSR